MCDTVVRSDVSDMATSTCNRAEIYGVTSTTCPAAYENHALIVCVVICNQAIIIKQLRHAATLSLPCHSILSCCRLCTMVLEDTSATLTLIKL